MSLATALSAYAALNAAMAVAALGLLAVAALARHFSARKLLSLNYAVCTALAVSLLISALLPEASFISPSASLWSAPSPRDLAPATAAAPAGWLSVGDAAGFDAGSVGRVWIATALTLLALGLSMLLRDLARLRAIQRHSWCVRRIGRVSVWVNDTVATPFSYWRPGRAHVVLPAWLIECPDQFRLVLAHELQHHRQRDTTWLHVFRVLRLLCCLNPFAHLWVRRVTQLQEYACDEAVTARPNYSVASYAHCLLDVAARGESMGTPRTAAALIGFGDPKTLIRRIEKMMQPKTSRRRRGTLALVTCFAAGMTFAAVAANSWIQDRRISAEQARQIVAGTAVNPAFPITVNDEVLRELNRYAGTPEGREFMRAALARRALHAGTVNAALAAHGVPADFGAVPIVESGYENLDASRSRLQAAGIWQFLAKTARRFDLRVDTQVDDRLDPDKESDAAARMLLADHGRFGDWQLALLAFNVGGEALQKGIDNTGSRDPWVLTRSGLGGDEGYLAKVHAAMIIAANPGMVAP
jgi:beta-lactamase regulating signal transducer with metallopeptidase domain